MKVLINGKDISEPMNSQQTPDKLLAFWGYEPGAATGLGASVGAWQSTSR